MADYNARRKVLELLLLHGPLSFEELQRRAKMRRSDDKFGLVMGTLEGARGRGIVEHWEHADTRWYRIKLSSRRAAEITIAAAGNNREITRK
jgi:hypothetical protein